MTSIQIKRIEGYGPYAYRVSYQQNGNTQESDLLSQLDGENKVIAEALGEDVLRQKINEFDINDTHVIEDDGFRLGFELSSKKDTLLEETSISEETIEKVKELSQDYTRGDLENPVEAFNSIPELDVESNDGTITKVTAELEKDEQYYETGVEKLQSLMNNDMGKTQKELYNEWKSTVGSEDELVSKKREADSLTEGHALGFALPQDIPATGESDVTTSLTAFGRIGPKRASEIHPEGEIMSVEDLSDLSEKQCEWVQGEFGDALDDMPKKARQSLMSNLALRDGLDVAPDDYVRKDDENDWVDAANTMTIGNQFEGRDMTPIDSVGKDERDNFVFEAESGDRSIIDSDRKAILDEIAKTNNGRLKRLDVDGGEEGTPVIYDVEDSDNSFMIAPRVPDDDERVNAMYDVETEPVEY